MGDSYIVDGGRFYLPRPYDGPEVLHFTHLSGEPFAIEAARVSCFELLRLDGCLRDYVILQTGLNGHILQENKAEVLIELTGVNQRAK